MAQTGAAAISNRVAFIDTARGIAMLCIIFGHLGIDPINRVVYTFHVPLFFLITGYFVSTKPSVGDFTKKRARTLLMPYFLTGGVIVVGWVLLAALVDGFQGMGPAILRWSLALLYGAGVDGLVVPETVRSIGLLWFLWASFWGSVGLRLLLQLKHEWLRALIVAVLFLGGVLTAPLFFLPLDIQSGCAALGYMYLGYLARTYVVPKLQTLPRWAKGTGFSLAAAWWLAYISLGDTVVFAAAVPGRYWWSIFGILAGCITVLLLSWALTKRFPRLAEYVQYIGYYSLIVMCIHAVELWFLPFGVLTDLFTSDGITHGLAAVIAVGIKLGFIFWLTTKLANWNWSRRLFGFAPRV